MTQTIANEGVVVIGAGPVGIAAAAHLAARGIEATVLEQGPSAGSAMLEWGHVQVFTPWRYVTDDAVVAMLEKAGWRHPEGERLPTGREIVEDYLASAAALPAFRGRIVYDASVVAVSKRGLSKSSSARREDAPFTVHYQTADGARHVIETGAVIDASGTWSSPNPIGADGAPVPGETENAASIAYGIPDASGVDRALYAGKRTLVLGGGHSAINVALDILALKDDAPATKLVWGLRQDNLEKLLGGGINDELPARGALGVAAKQAIEEGALELLAPMRVLGLEKTAGGVLAEIEADGQTRSIELDRIVVAAGFRPDLDMLRELRLDLDQVVEAPVVLAPMIDPNVHSCGTVRPHGVDELSHPEKNFFIAGMKSYGRAPTFLMKTGYEQVRSIAAELAGDPVAARRIELDLPETGVCSGAPDAGDGCCGPAASSDQPKALATAGCCG